MLTRVHWRLLLLAPACQVRVCAYTCCLQAELQLLDPVVMPIWTMLLSEGCVVLPILDVAATKDVFRVDGSIEYCAACQGSCWLHGCQCNHCLL
jgi:hypothetical protein